MERRKLPTDIIKKMVWALPIISSFNKIQLWFIDHIGQRRRKRIVMDKKTLTKVCKP